MADFFSYSVPTFDQVCYIPKDPCFELEPKVCLFEKISFKFLSLKNKKNEIRL